MATASPFHADEQSIRELIERDPEQRLRLTIGLRKLAGRWVVTHEHHSFTDAT